MYISMCTFIHPMINVCVNIGKLFSGRGRCVSDDTCLGPISTVLLLQTLMVSSELDPENKLVYFNKSMSVF